MSLAGSYRIFCFAVVIVLMGCDLYPFTTYTIRMSAEIEGSSFQRLKKLATDNGLEKGRDEIDMGRGDEYVSYFSVPGRLGPEGARITLSMTHYKPGHEKKIVHIRIDNIGTGFGPTTKTKIDELGEIFHQEMLKLAIDKEVEFTRRLPWCYKEGAIRK